MAMPEPLLETNLEGLKLFNRGKVRDIYDLGEHILIVTTDRISAYDSILGSGIPWKGKVLTKLTEFWLAYLADLTENHLVTTDVDEMGAEAAPHKELLRGRSMLVKRAEVIPVECVVRGYLAGSGWREYREQGAVCGIKLPPGLQEADKLPEPIFTPATKAESGHDVNISMDEAVEMAGEQTAEELRSRSLAIYAKASEYAAGRGVLISDTKFEWGRCDGVLTLIDEVLTPDSSRFWPAGTYSPGASQLSYDKQYVRDWLDQSGWNHEPPAPALPQEVVEKTAERYLTACRQLAGEVPQ